MPRASDEPTFATQRKMDKDTATSVISAWLLPRVRFWVACRKGVEEEAEWAPMPSCYTCDKPAFCRDDCAACVKERATDPKGHADKYSLCDACLSPLVGTWHCDYCYGAGPLGPCRACSAEMGGSDWACYGFCSRSCAVSMDKKHGRYW